MELTSVVIESPGGRAIAEFVPAANMLCRSLRIEGAELLDQTHGLPAYAEQGKTMGIPLLYPWANRLSRHGFTSAGQEFTLPAGRYPTDPNGLPIHGAIPGELVWEVFEQGADGLSARLRWTDPELLALFPFAHELTLQARIADTGLSLTTTVHASGGDQVPVAFGFHPYLKLPEGDRTGWRVALGATERLLLDERMIPTGAREPLRPHAFTLADSSWDAGLAGLTQPPVFTAATGDHRLTVSFDEGFDWAQVYAPPGKDFICFEPMTAPTDALNSGDGLHVLAPGQSYRARFTVTLTHK